MAVSLSSISATSGTLTAPGVGSGLDIKGLVSQLMAAEQRPLTLLNSQEADLQSRLTSLGTVTSALSSLQPAAQALAAAGVAYATVVSDPTVLAASAFSNSIGGNYSVNVTQLAQAQKLISPSPGLTSLTATIGSGSATTLTITLGTLGTLGGTFTPDASKTPVPVKIDSTNNTLTGIRDAINAAGAGVTASIINDGGATPYHLALTSNATGAVNSMKLAVSGDAAITSMLGYNPDAPTSNFSEVQPAQDAKLTVDKVDITSATNSVSGAIQGVTLNLTKATGTAPGSAITVSVRPDNSKVITALGGLVDAYNSANTTIAGVTAKGAVLQGNWAVLALQRQIRSILGSAQSTGTSFTTMSQLGVSFQKDGSLALDSAKLNTALLAHPADASGLAAAIGNAVKTAADNVLGPTGPIPSASAGINRSIADIATRRTDIQAHLDQVQALYQAQFTSLDTLMSSMSQTSTFLTQQLNNLPNYFNH
jgi:flagellar hook-associated protein 2